MGVGRAVTLSRRGGMLMALHEHVYVLPRRVAGVRLPEWMIESRGDGIGSLPPDEATRATAGWLGSGSIPSHKSLNPINSQPDNGPYLAPGTHPHGFQVFS